MPAEVHEYQNLKPGSICVDCTLGGAGHALSTLKAILPNGLLIGIDQDIDAIEHARKTLAPFKDNVRLFHSNFSELPGILQSNGIQGADSILLDLGFSLHQIRHGKRGFSFQLDEPLDMRMDIRNELTAEHIINSFSERKLKEIFFRFGEENFSSRIARAIVQKRTETPIRTSMALANIVASAVPGKARFNRKIHPATRVFQALRIAVNKELERLQTFMEQVPDMLVQGGRICVISFHSLEDRIVKQTLKNFESGCTCPRELPHCGCGFVPRMKSVLRKPLAPTKEEIEANPMARSSRLRVAQRI